MKNLSTIIMGAIVAIAINAVLCVGPAQAVEIDWPEPNWPDIFEPNWPVFGGPPNEPMTLYLEMDPCDWQYILYSTPGEGGPAPDCIYDPCEVPAWFWMKGEEDKKIRVEVRRKKGFAFPDEITPEKVALKIDINQYFPRGGDPNWCVPGTQPGDDGYCDPNAAPDWHGQKKLSLEVNIDSQDVISEGVAINIHRMASATEGYGWPVFYGNWVKLYVNGDYKGVYANAEQRDKQFMRNRDLYVSHDSWLYKYPDCEKGFVLRVGDEDFPRSPALEALCYDPFVNTGDDPNLYPTGGVCPTPNDANVVADMNQWVNMKRLLSSAAIDAFLANSGVLFQNEENTYFLDWNLDDPCETRKRMYFPWDLDSSFKGTTQDIYYTDAPRMYDEVIMQNPVFRAQYNQIMRDLLDGPLTFADINDFLDMVEPVINDAVTADSYAMDHIFDRWGASSVAECFDALRSWFKERIPNVRNQVDWEEPLMPPGTVLLNDDFNNVVWDANWTNTGWVQDTTTYAHDSPSAHAYKDNYGDFTCVDLDANDATAIHVDFWIQKHKISSFTAKLYYYNGTSYVEVCDIDGIGADDAWLHYTDTITDSQYFVPNFRIRFSASLAGGGPGRDIWVDEVAVTKEIPAATPCDAANLDGINPVNFVDLAILADDWRLTGAGLTGDITGDGVVDEEDLAEIAKYWLNDCL